MKSVLQGKFGYRLGAIVLGAVWLGLAGLCARVSEKVIAAADESRSVSAAAVAAHRARDRFHRGAELMAESARRYAATGDLSAVDDYFNEAVMVRNRERAAVAMRGDPEAASLRPRMDAAMTNAVGLMKLECHAMKLTALATGTDMALMPAAVRERKLAEGEEELSPDAKRFRALDILFGPDYAALRSATADIAQDALKDFEADGRRLDAVLRMRVRDLRRAQLAQGVLLLLTTVLFFAFVRAIRRANARIEAMLRSEAEEARVAKKARLVFLLNMSHDLRTPLNAVLGFSELARKNVADAARTEDYLSRIEVAGSHLLSIVNELTDLSRPRGDQVVLSESRADMALCGKSVLPMLEGTAARKRIELKFVLGNIRDRHVWMDFLQVNRIFVNLVSNAIKFTPEGGRIVVTVRQLVGSGDTPGKCVGWYEFTVEDNGVGMSPEFVRRAFEPFARELRGTGPGEQGSGMGLAICKLLVHAMKGRIDVTSAPGKGSKFTVTLPLRIQDCAEGEKVEAPADSDSAVTPVAADAATLKGKRVLVVEDNDLNREIETEILASAGLVTETAPNGLVAVRMVDGHRPTYYDFVLMDVQMPVMDGYEATRRIRALSDPGFKTLPIIAISASAFAEDRAASLAAGMNDHIAKPFSTAELLVAMLKLRRS